MQPGDCKDCKGWEYKHFPDWQRIVCERSASLLTRLKSGALCTRKTSLDTRLAHGELFVDLTPASCPYFAGNYRGCPRSQCLTGYAVGIKSDKRVGCPPAMVAWEMAAFQKAIGDAVTALDAASLLEDLAADDKRANAIVAVAALFELFLRIHPYANGNGHAARLIVIAILGRCGFWPQRFYIEPRPGAADFLFGSDDPYTAAIAATRDGNREPLEQFILEMM